MRSAIECSAFFLITAWPRPIGRLTPRSIRRFGQAMPTTCCWCRSEFARQRGRGSLFGRQSAQEGLGGGGRANFGAVDEIDKAIPTALCQQPVKTLCPLIERFGRITGGLALGTAPQAGVDEIGGHLVESGIVVVVDEGEGDPMAAQQIGKRERFEAAVTDFDHVAYRAAVEALRQRLEKSVEAGLIEGHPWRKLPQDGAELLAQFEHAAGEEAVDRGGRGCEIPAMCRVARSLEGEDKVLGRLAVPPAETRRPLRTVERTVDLDRGDLAARIAELASLWQARRVEEAAPRWVNPTADPDANRCVQ